VSAIAKPREDSAVAEGFYWMAEKFAWGYEHVEPNLGEAYRLFRRAADLGFSDALIRVGELQEHGRGTARDPDAAVRSYIAAARHSNFFAFAYLARMLSCGSHLGKAESVWNWFFASLAANPEPRFVASTVANCFIPTSTLSLGWA
jgi:TPR repeat protein